jgi:polyisoprenoid-binding protein YceI
MITETTVAAGTYTIDPTRSRVTFTTSHAFGLGPVAGTMAVRDGVITVADDPTRSSVRARVDAGSFTTDKRRRDTDIRSKRFLDAANHPDLAFVSDRLVRDGAGWKLHGHLTVRGRTAPVVLEVLSAEAGAGGCAITARTTVDRYAFKVGPRGILSRYVGVELHIEG